MKTNKILILPSSGLEVVEFYLKKTFGGREGCFSRIKNLTTVLFAVKCSSCAITAVIILA